MMWSLAAMENALFSDRTLDWDRRCAHIAAAGFDGVYAVPYPLCDDDLPRLARLGEAPAQDGLELAGIYANIDLAAPEDSAAARRLIRLFETVTATPRVELSFKCTDSAALPESVDDAILARLDPLLAIAEKRGFDLALYPHSFYPLETVAHAERIVRHVGHPRLGYVFPTSHAYALRPAEEVAACLEACAGRIASFNICGCRRLSPKPPAKCVPLPLDEGELPLGPIFTALATGGYHGPVIVQGHGWTGDAPAMLRRCATTFRDLMTSTSRRTSQPDHI